MDRPSPPLHPRKEPVQPRALATYASMREAAAQIPEPGASTHSIPTSLPNEPARLIDIGEARQEVQHEVETASDFRGLLRGALDHPDLPSQADPELAIDDLAALVRLLVDAAGARGESGMPQLERRVLGVMLGYLGSPADLDGY